MRRVTNFNEVVSEIKEHIIFELSFLFPELRKPIPMGMFYKTRCPFHRDRNPSLVHFGLKWIDRPQGWHCFACQSEGSIIDYYMERTGLPFFQSVIRLAKIFKIKVKWDDSGYPKRR